MIIAVSQPSHWQDWSAAMAADLFGVSEWLDGELEKAKTLALQSILTEGAQSGAGLLAEHGRERCRTHRPALESRESNV
jgi:hypothetical protein